jgi:mannose-6-phosphate isomerase-like protein (cupin superfamily)
MTDPYVLRSGEGRTFHMGPDAIRVLLEADATDGQFSVLEASLAPGLPGPPAHVHRDGLDEIWYVLDGELDFLVGEQTIRAGRGATAYIPAGAVHTFSNPGDSAARWLGIFRPANGLAMIEELADAFPADGPPDVDRMMATFERYRVEVVEPPPPA